MFTLQSGVIGDVVLQIIVLVEFLNLGDHVHVGMVVVVVMMAAGVVLGGEQTKGKRFSRRWRCCCCWLRGILRERIRERSDLRMYIHLVIVRGIAIPGLRRIIGGANTGPVRESVVGEFRLRRGGERTSRVATVVRVAGGVVFIAVRRRRRRQDERPVLHGDHGGSHCLLEKRNEREKKKRAVVGK